MRAELRLAWVRDVPVVTLLGDEGALAMPLGEPGAGPDGEDGPRLPSGLSSPSEGAQEPE
jgi:hypothetical protein